MKNIINIGYHETKLGKMLIGSYKEKLCILGFGDIKKSAINKRLKNGLETEFIEDDDKIIIKTKKQLDEYFNEKRKIFDVPIIMFGTEFQKKVWNALLKIPYGKTVSYSNIAKNINNPKAVRAVGSANGANLISIIIPCHRVINANGNLGGYGGGLGMKKALLDLEKNIEKKN